MTSFKVVARAAVPIGRVVGKAANIITPPPCPTSPPGAEAAGGAGAGANDENFFVGDDSDDGDNDAFDDDDDDDSNNDNGNDNGDDDAIAEEADDDDDDDDVDDNNDDDGDNDAERGPEREEVADNTALFAVFESSPIAFFRTPETSIDDKQDGRCEPENKGSVSGKMMCRRRTEWHCDNDVLAPELGPICSCHQHLVHECSTLSFGRGPWWRSCYPLHRQHYFLEPDVEPPAMVYVRFMCTELDREK
jgi:hypothetical protein